MRSQTPDILTEMLETAPRVSQETRGALVWVPLGRIYDNPFQPRLNTARMTQLLADNIWGLRGDLPATLGLQQPPVARVVRFGTDGDAAPVDTQPLQRQPGAAGEK
jgi:hypothetical protein